MASRRSQCSGAEGPARAVSTRLIRGTLTKAPVFPCLALIPAPSLTLRVVC